MNLRCVVPNELVRTLYKATGALVAWEIELRWKRVGTGSLAGKLIYETDYKLASSETSNKKRFARWKNWESAEGSFASGNAETVHKVVQWCIDNRLFTRDEGKGVEEILTLILLFLNADLSTSNFHGRLVDIQGKLLAFAEIERIPRKKTSFVDLRTRTPFRKSDLKKLAPKKVRLSIQGSRWTAIEAAVAALEASEKIQRILANAELKSKDRMVPKKSLDSYAEDAEQIINRLFASMKKVAFTDEALLNQGHEVVTILAEKMRKRFDDLMQTRTGARRNA